MKLRPVQEQAVTHIFERNESLVFARPGAGKTVVTLTALSEMFDEGVIRRTLVTAPLRVAELVWQQEAADPKWPHLNHLRVAVATGTPAERDEAMASGSHIVVVNHENLIDFLAKHGKGFDCVVIDELSKFKGPTSAKWRPFLKYTDHIAIRIGLTGSPVPNAPEDLFGQTRAIDKGRRLGRQWERWRGANMREQSENVWKCHPGTLERTLAQIADMTFILTPESWKPPPVEHVEVPVELPPGLRRAYTELDEQNVAEIDGEELLPGGRAQVVNKMRQICAGFYYDELGDAKRLDMFRVDAICNVVDRQVSPVLLVYDYREQLDKLKARYPDAPVLGSGTSRKVAAKAVEDWNAGRLPVLIAHPAAFSHGLNLQYGGHIVCWCSLPWSLDHYEQTIMRLAREGQLAPATISYATVAVDTIEDREVYPRLIEKAAVQDAVFEGTAVERSTA
jgi:hypothetical protein